MQLKFCYSAILLASCKKVKEWVSREKNWKPSNVYGYYGILV